MALDFVTFASVLSQLGGFGANPNLAVAVSGGPDSMALCHLLQKWLTDRGSGQLSALIIDHGLRSESLAEAKLTQGRLKAFGIVSHIISWDGDKPVSRIQESARQARYQYLEAWCQQNGVIHLLTGHHLDDQWETVVSRLQKKSDIRGLRGILPISYRPFGRILRPLLGVTKTEIMLYLEHNKIEFSIDPSNANPKYQRVYLRQNRQELEQDFPNQVIYNLIEQSKSATNDMDRALVDFVVSAVNIHRLGYFTICKNSFKSLEFSSQIEFVRRLAGCMSVSSYPVSKTKAATVVRQVLQNKRCTLGGWLIVPNKGGISVVRESRAMIPDWVDRAGNSRWDRFIVTPESTAFEPQPNLPSYITKTVPKRDGLVLKFINPLLA